VSHPHEYYNGSIYKLANELLDEIASYLPRDAQIRFMRTSKLMHDVGSRHLYREINTTGLQARRFCLTIISKNLSGVSAYAEHVRSFSYHGSGFFDVCLTYPLVCDALAAMSRLRMVSLSIPEGNGDFFLDLMNKKHIFRKHVNVTSLMRLSTPPSPKLFSRVTLPMLENLEIGGDLSILRIAQHRKIRRVTFTEELFNGDLGKVIQILGNFDATGSVNTILRTLSVRIGSGSIHETFSQFLLLSDAFPGLESLSYGSPHLNALVCHLSRSSTKTYHC